MRVYCFVCPRCGRKSERGALPEPGEQLVCGPCLVGPGREPALNGPKVELVRDWKAENVGIGSGVRESRWTKDRQDTRTLAKWAEGEASAVGVKE